jgi:hypothetical protein
VAVLGQSVLAVQIRNPYRLLVALIVVLQVAGIAGLMVYQTEAVVFPYSIDYGEGPLLDQVERLVAGEPIYRADYNSPAYVIANYPPVYLLANAPFEALFGPAYWYGRLISVLSIHVTALLIGLTLFALTGDRLASLLGGLSLLFFPAVFSWSLLFRVDTLALALSWGGLYAVVRSKGRGRYILLSALLMTGAIFTRQTYALAAPLAGLVWLWSGRFRKPALLLAGLIAVFSLLLFLALNLATEGGFFYSIIMVNAGQDFTLTRILGWVKALIRYSPVFLLFGGLFVIMGRRAAGRSYWFVVTYLLCGLAVFLTIGKVGSAQNYLYELCAGLCLTTGFVLAHHAARAWVRGAALALLGLQLAFGFLALAFPRDSYSALLTDRLSQRYDIDRMQALIHQQPTGDILADEFSGLLPLDSRRIFIEPLLLTQLHRQGEWNDAGLINAIQQHRFPLIILDTRGGETVMRERWTPDTLAAIEQYYQPALTLAQSAVYLPKSQ